MQRHNDPPDQSPRSPEQIPGGRKWLTLIVLSLGVSLIVIDGTIVNVSLPVMIDDLHLNFTDAQWVSTIYSLIFAGLLITAGRLGDRLGRRRLFAAGVVVFVLGSLLGGTANATGTLLVARTIQGIGGALILPSTLSTVNATFRGRDRTIAFGVWGAVISGMAAVGPLLGGWLTTDFSWRWIFYVNLPVGALVLAGIALYVPESQGSEFAPGLDIDGFLLSSIGLAALVFGLVEGRTYGWWTPKQDVHLLGLIWPRSAPLSLAAAAIIGGVALLALFILWERYRARIGRSALIDLALFRHRSFRWGNVALLVVAIGEFGLLFALPLYLQNVLGLTALESGYVLAAMALGAFLAGGMASELARKINPANIASIGLALETVGLVVLALTVRPESAGWQIALVLVLYGAGLGLASAQLTGVVLSDVPPEASGQGSSFQSTVRQIGSAMGFAVLATILGSSITSHARGVLASVPGLPPQMANQLEQAVSASAGGIIAQIRGGAVPVPRGQADIVAAHLSSAFVDATRVTMFAGAGFLALGLVATLLIPRAPLPAQSGENAPTSDKRAQQTSGEAAQPASD